MLRIKKGTRWKRETKGFRTKIRVAIPLTRIHILHRRRARGKGNRETVGYPPFRVCLCTTAGASALQLPEWVRGRATRPASEGPNRREEGDRDRGPPESLYYKQPRTCCNHLETMAHRSVRLAKRPGPHNSRDASSTTLRAIVGPLRLLVCFFPPRTNSFLPRRDPRRRLLDVSRAGKRRRTLKQVIPEECVYQIFHDTSRVKQFLHKFQK